MRLGPQFQKPLLPQPVKRKPVPALHGIRPYKFKVTLDYGDVQTVREIVIHSNAPLDVRAAAEYCADRYPDARCAEVRLMKR